MDENNQNTYSNQGYPQQPDPNQTYNQNSGYQQADPNQGYNQNYNQGYNQGYSQQNASYQQYPEINRYQDLPSYHNYLSAIVGYMGIIGLIIAVLAVPSYERTDYLKYHLNQSITLLLFSLISIIPILGWFWSIFILVCYVMAIIYAVKGQQRSATFFGNIGHFIK